MPRAVLTLIPSRQEHRARVESMLQCRLRSFTTTAVFIVDGGCQLFKRILVRYPYNARKISPPEFCGSAMVSTFPFLSCLLYSLRVKQPPAGGLDTAYPAVGC